LYFIIFICSIIFFFFILKFIWIFIVIFINKTIVIWWILTSILDYWIRICITKNGVFNIVVFWINWFLRLFVTINCIICHKISFARAIFKWTIWTAAILMRIRALIWFYIIFIINFYFLIKIPACFIRYTKFINF